MGVVLWYLSRTGKIGWSECSALLVDVSNSFCGVKHNNIETSVPACLHSHLMDTLLHSIEIQLRKFRLGPNVFVFVHQVLQLEMSLKQPLSKTGIGLKYPAFTTWNFFELCRLCACVWLWSLILLAQSSAYYCPPSQATHSAAYFHRTIVAIICRCDACIDVVKAATQVVPSHDMHG